MNRIYHYFHSVTAYGLHSPFVYRLYTEVVYPRPGAHEPKQRAERLVQRLGRYYGVERVGEGDGVVRLLGKGLEFAVVEKPHRCEARWKGMCADSHWTVSVDLFDVGILICNPNLHRACYLLR